MNRGPDHRGKADEWFAEKLQNFETAARHDRSLAIFDFLAAAKLATSLGHLDRDAVAAYAGIITSAPRARSEWARHNAAASSRPNANGGDRAWRSNMSRTRGGSSDEPSGGRGGDGGGSAKPPKLVRGPRGPRHDALFEKALADSFEQTNASRSVPAARGAAPSSTGARAGSAHHTKKQTRPHSANVTHSWGGGVGSRRRPVSGRVSCAEC